MSDASVHVKIDRIALGLHLRGEHERLEPVARRLCELAGGRLQDALARVDLGVLTGEDDTGEIVFIERLAVDCNANTAWNDDAIAAHLARRLALALQAGTRDAKALRFRDRADYVAAALVAVAEGQATRCWWFEEFDGLRHLSRSTALRTLIINEGSAGVAALARLTDTALMRVLGVLGDGDGARLLAWLSQRSSDTLPPLQALWQAVAQFPEPGGHAVWLQALMVAERAVAGSANAASLCCLRSLIALRRLARDGQPIPAGLDARTLLRDLLLRHKLDAQWLAAASEPDVAALVSELVSLAASAPKHGTANTSFTTPEGGFFVLLGRLQSKGWMHTWQGVIAQADTDRLQSGTADALCRALACQVAALAAGGPLATRVLRDNAVQAACGVHDAADCIRQHSALACAALRRVLRGGAADVAPAHPAASGANWRGRRALSRLLSEAALVLLADYARVLPGLATSSPGFLRSQALALHAVLQTSDQLTTVRLGRAPLNVLLVLTGVKRATFQLPGVPVLQLLEDHGA